MFDLTGKVALVTGAAHGLGKGIAICLAKAGAHVVINDICEPKEAEDALSQVETAEKPAVFMQADVSEEAEVTRLFQHIKERFGKLDILINNAGTSQDRDIYSITTDDWSRILKTNLTSGFLCSRAAFPLMRERQYGRIIFVSSVVGERGALFGHAHYAASKSGQIGLVKTLARTGAPDHITVNAIAPGWIDTPMFHKATDNDPPRLAKIMGRIPAKSVGDPMDVGMCAAFLCSDAARYISGTCIPVDGGALIGF